MTTTKITVRRSLAVVFATSALGGIAVAAVVGPSASAAPDPCQASEVAKTVGTVATDTGTYLEENPQTNLTLTYISKQPAPQSLVSLKAYFDAHPEVSDDLTEIQEPLSQLATQCDLPLTISQLTTLMQNMQAAQSTAAVPGAADSPAATSPAAAVPAATGPAAATTSGT